MCQNVTNYPIFFLSSNRYNRFYRHTVEIKLPCKVNYKWNSFQYLLKVEWRIKFQNRRRCATSFPAFQLPHKNVISKHSQTQLQSSKTQTRTFYIWKKNHINFLKFGYWFGEYSSHNMWVIFTPIASMFWCGSPRTWCCHVVSSPFIQWLAQQQYLLLPLRDL